MASNPPGACCTRRTLFEGDPKGQNIKLDDGKTDAYLATPPADKTSKKDIGILYIPDVFGIWQNSKLMADEFAAEGYTTLLADYFDGDPVPVNMPEGFDIMAWLTNGSDGKHPHTEPHIDPVVLEGIKTLKARGIKKIGAVGYCFGGKYVVRHFKSGIDAGYTAHPSFINEDELAAISGPLSIAAAETDAIFPADKRHKSEEILAKTGQPYQVNLFYGVEHGFAVRGDPTVRANRFGKDQAFKQAVAWFDEFLVNA